MATLDKALTSHGHHAHAIHKHLVRTRKRLLIGTINRARVIEDLRVNAEQAEEYARDLHALADAITANTI